MNLATRRMSVQSAICFAICIMAAGRSYAETVIFVDKSYPPYMSAGKDNQPRGLYVEIIKEAFKCMGEKVDIQAVPWKRALKDSKDGLKGGVGGIYDNNERRTYFDYSDPIFSEEIHVYSRKEDKQFSAIEDLYDRKVGLNTAWSYGETIDEAKRSGKFQIISAGKNNKANLRLILRKRIDFLPCDQIACNKIISKNKEMSSKLQAGTKPVSSNYGYLVFPKAMKKIQLLDQFNACLKKTEENGIKETIIRKYTR